MELLCDLAQPSPKQSQTDAVIALNSDVYKLVGFCPTHPSLKKLRPVYPSLIMPNLILLWHDTLGLVLFRLTKLSLSLFVNIIY